MNKQLMYSLVLIPLSLTSVAFADGGAPWNDSSPAEYSAAGALSIGVGALQTIATPVKLTGQILDSQNPVDASGRAMKNLTQGLTLTGAGVVLLVEGTGKGLSELTTETIKTTGNLVGTTVETINDHIPRVTITFNHDNQPARKTIPLVVRPHYVEMNEKVEAQPCQ